MLESDRATLTRIGARADALTHDDLKVAAKVSVALRGVMVYFYRLLC